MDNCHIDAKLLTITNSSKLQALFEAILKLVNYMEEKCSLAMDCENLLKLR